MEKEPLPTVLPACDLLAGFEEPGRRALTAYGQFHAFKPGQVVIREKENQDRLYLLIRGELRALHRLKGGMTPLGVIRPNEWFGEINIFDPQVASAMVMAHSDSQAWSIGRSGLEAFLNAQPALGCQLLLGVGEVLARRARGLVAKLNATWELSV